ncbi:MAG TPA: hypothetical protein VGF99_16820, partial [Myxococcota bacterium]
MRLLVFGRFSPIPDPTLQAVVIAARAAGHVVDIADVHAFVTGPVRWSPADGSLTLGALHLDDVAAVDVVLLGPLPSAFAQTAPPMTTSTAAAHDRRQKVQAARHQLAWSIVTDLEARGIPVLSSTSSRPFDHKPLQLAALQRAGVPVPVTVVTDLDGSVDDDATFDAAIVKPVPGGAVDVVRPAPGQPMLVQQRLHGPQLRVAVVGGAVVAAGVVVDRAGAAFVGDWRGHDVDFADPAAFGIDAELLGQHAGRAAAVC